MHYFLFNFRLNQHRTIFVIRVINLYAHIVFYIFFYRLFFSVDSHKNHFIYFYRGTSLCLALFMATLYLFTKVNFLFLNFIILMVDTYFLK